MSAKDYFDNAANTWDEKFHTPELSSFLEKLVPQFGLKFGQNILDVGTGTGVLIPYLIRAVGPSGSVTAIDYSEKMVQICKTKHSHIKNVSIKVGNIEEDAFPTESFDAVICFGVFPHLENKENALQNINSTLKPRGKLVIAHALSSEELKAHHKKVSEQVAHAMLPEKSKIIELLEQTGFTQIIIKDEPGCYLCTAHKS
ncbi:MAG: class I SAM-dependent methyltransferase [Candidatus Bathyarchaeum sp.]|nr:MAG: class I SAM-dependent methyltransferase [Candidatus Bathyarchaeum sp.]